MDLQRTPDLQRFYRAIERLLNSLGGTRTLGGSSGKLMRPRRGVYFFMEDGETRAETGTGPRIVRVGTHALKPESSTKLWTRLSQHRGRVRGDGGNHRGSIFRLIVGTALKARDGHVCDSWGVGSSASADIRAGEVILESEVSWHICKMPFVWIEANDDPGPSSLRGYIEQNAIALLSNYGKESADPPSPGWLGRYCDRERVRRSGLWNSNHVDERYDPKFLDCLEAHVLAMERLA
jgi:hypothetical protein